MFVRTHRRRRRNGLRFTWIEREDPIKSTGRVVPSDNYNGNSQFLGFVMQQRPHIIEAINYLLDITKPKRIIELGTGTGGLTVFMGLYCYQTGECNLYTFDNKRCNDRTLLLLDSLNVRSNFADVLNDTDIIKYIQQLITLPGVTILLCDNGDKNREIRLYAPYLKSGDVIMVHDYIARGKKHLWRYSEVQLDKIRDIIVGYNLHSYMQDMFDDYMWLCLRRVG